jgi:hypothetical protein
MPLPHIVPMLDYIVEDEKFGIEYPMEINRSQAHITSPNAVYSAYPKWTLMVA